MIKIYDTLSEQDKSHVAPNMFSLAEAFINYPNAWLREIEVDNMVVGFVMLGIDNYIAPEEDLPLYFLWSFMVGTQFQGKGYGKEVLDLIVKKCKDENRRYCYVSCALKDPMPYAMYIKYGFEDTGKEDEGEQILRFKISE